MHKGNVYLLFQGVLYAKKKIGKVKFCFNMSVAFFLGHKFLENKKLE